MLTTPDSLLKYVTDVTDLRLPDGHFIDGTYQAARSGRTSSAALSRCMLMV